ncbi:malectin domain-containing carbohydrate-binding protein [Corallibacter sp.]|uniref:malectin domain-containing carbohydrate-binding protein n=1 Tax=Corallibacter sp. TaxID=2038084 RepID=UPI003AB1502F
MGFSFLKKPFSKGFLVLSFTATLFTFHNTIAQSISFGSSGLANENVLNPTSLEFGPDERLYVAQQNGIIWAYEIERDAATAGNGTYTVISSEEITNIRFGIPNHTDGGNPNPSQQRLITGLATAGTSENPIIYVSSSDYLLGGGGGGNDTNLDTNSSMLSKLEWDGSAWTKIDLIRGLPRCEENHAINGMDLFEKDGSTYMLIAQGGQTNKGAPSNNFAGTPEYFLSGAILIVNLTQLESMPVYTDPRTNTQYVYDLPTLNDPTRLDIDNTSEDFPYPSGHPMYNATIDVGDPFGGNNSLNQAFAEPGAPIQIFSPGYRNPYDIIITENGRIYTSDNGPNSLWGGFPKIYDSATDIYLGDESTITYDPLNHYIKNEINESGSTIVRDPLHFIGSTNDANGTYYGGHPNPILAFPSRADVITYNNSGGVWTATNTYDLETLLPNVSGYFQSSFTIADFPDQPRLGEYLVDEPTTSTRVNILDNVNASTNGITEYTATNFDGAMQGNILTASFNGGINRYVLNPEGDTVLEHEVTFNGFGSLPLDVTAQGDNDVFPGTVWAATYGSNSITIFEPTDLSCFLPGDPEYDPQADYDGDGYTNQDEIDNGTNICSQSSKPNDNDGDNVSDLNDDDDDNDGILDVNDAFALDPDNGTTTNLPIDYPFWNNDPGTGLYGLGFTGLMVNPAGTTDYLTQFTDASLSFGGAAGKATVENVNGGDAFQNNNDQRNGFQFGINVDTNSPNPFTIHSKVESPFFGSNGSQQDPIDFQSYGISFGTGDQDNYMKMAIMNGTSNSDNISGLQVLLEENGIVTQNLIYDIPGILNASSVDLYFSIDPDTNEAQPFYSIDDGNNLILLGTPIALPTSFLDPNDNKGLAITLMSTSRAGATSNPFTATWDFIEVYENLNGQVSVSPNPLDFELTPVSNTQRTKYVTLKNDGGPIDDPITITGITFGGTDASLFSSDAIFPIVIGPGSSIEIPIDFSSDNIVGVKNATMNVTHSGINSPTANIDITGELTDIYGPIIRINAGGPMVTASDDGPDWEENTTTTGISYAVTSGSSFSVTGMYYEDRDVSIPDYIDSDSYYEVMRYERSNSDESFPMIFSIALPNGNYIVNLYFNNLYNGTSEPGERIFSVNLENERRINHLDPSGEFGYRSAGMIQNNVTITDGLLEIEFIAELQDPLINAIEIMGIQYPEILVYPIADQSNCELEFADFAVVASGGNPSDNLLYEMSGQPLGVHMEPTNGLIFGTIDESAVTGGPNSDGVYQVTVTVSKPGSLSKSVNFEWTVVDDTEAPIITCPEAISETISSSETHANITIVEPSASDNCATDISYSGERSDLLPITDPYPIGETTITWTATDASGNTSLSCDQTITVTSLDPIILLPKAYLQGASLYPNTGEEALMRDDLRISGLIPTTSPYSDMKTCSSGVFTTTGTNAIVDWVWVELRDATDNTIVIDSQSALIQRDGDIVDADGTSALNFLQAANSYYVVVNHRNHLGVMTATTLALSNTPTVVDFSNGSTATYGTNSQTTYGTPSGFSGLWAGDINNNNEIRYLGPSNDSAVIKTTILNAPSNTTNSNYYPFEAYHQGDINMDGQVRYLGPDNDKGILKEIITNHPSNPSSNYYPINEQLPN